MHFPNLAPDHLIAVTVGEPAGIGPDICLDLVNQSWSGNLIIIGDSEVMRERANLLNKNIDFIKVKKNKTKIKINPHGLNSELKSPPVIVFSSEKRRVLSKEEHCRRILLELCALTLNVTTNVVIRKRNNRFMSNSLLHIRKVERYNH